MITRWLALFIILRTILLASRAVPEYSPSLCRKEQISLAPDSEAGPRDPRQRFVELANKRVTNAIRSMRLVGNLSNRRAYQYTDADAKKIVRALQEELDVLKMRFRGDRGNDSTIFSL